MESCALANVGFVGLGLSALSEGLSMSISFYVYV